MAFNKIDLDNIKSKIPISAEIEKKTKNSWKKYFKGCNFDGIKNWRLPTRLELCRFSSNRNNPIKSKSSNKILGLLKLLLVHLDPQKLEQNKFVPG